MSRHSRYGKERPAYTRKGYAGTTVPPPCNQPPPSSSTHTQSRGGGGKRKRSPRLPGLARPNLLCMTPPPPPFLSERSSNHETHEAGNVHSTHPHAWACKGVADEA